VSEINLSRAEIFSLFNEWLIAWNEHDLDGVMKLFHENIVFENWNCARIVGKNLLKKSWIPWFSNHGNFKFIEEDLFFDEVEQKMLFKWRLEWPSYLNQYKGKREIRHGVDVLYFQDGKIIQKYTYSKTTIKIDGSSISL
jgi:hypothetical protein